MSNRQCFSAIPHRSNTRTSHLAGLRPGLSLLELVVVLSILVALGGLAIRLAGPNVEQARTQASSTSLTVVRDAVLQYWSDTKHIALSGAPDTVATEATRFHIEWLFRNPVDDSLNAAATYKENGIGWNGPYIATATGDYIVDAGRGFTTDYGAADAQTVLDGYPILVGGVRYPGSPIVIQDVAPVTSPREIRIVSAGPNGTIDIPGGVTESALTAADIGDDTFVTLQLR